MQIMNEFFFRYAIFSSKSAQTRSENSVPEVRFGLVECANWVL